MASRVTQSFSLRPETLRRVRALADSRELKLSAVVDALLMDALDQLESVTHATTDPTIMAAVAEALNQPGVLRSFAQVFRRELTDEQLSLFTSPVVELRPSALKSVAGLAAGPKGRPGGSKVVKGSKKVRRAT